MVMSDLLFSVMRTIGSGLAAQRRKMEAIASNIANAETTRTADGLPYRKKTVRIAEATETRKVRTAEPGPSLRLTTTSPAHISGGRIEGGRAAVIEDSAIRAEVLEASPDRVKYVYDPHHPDANTDGYVAYPDINPVEEMVDMITASRAYEANAAAMDAFKSMIEKALEI
jgi:flagellar basal-body rod protein FlgC